MRKPISAAMIAAVCVFAAAGTASAETVIRVSDWLPPTHLISKDIIHVWGDKVEEATDGRVKIEYVGGVGKPQAYFDLIRDGVADVGFSVHSYTADRFQLTYGVELPFYAETATAASVAYRRAHERYFAKADEHEGVKLLGMWLTGPGGVYTTEQSVTSVSDLDGVKLRVPGGIVRDISERLGVVPVFAPASELYEMLSKGVADGVMISMESIVSFKVDEIINHHTFVPGGLYRNSQFFVMNEDKWNSLSEADQKAIESVSGEAMAYYAGDAWDRADAAAYERLKARGVEFRQASSDFINELADRLSPLETAWVERANELGVDGRAALSYFRSEVIRVQDELDSAD